MSAEVISDLKVDRADAVLLIVDVQERLASAMDPTLGTRAILNLVRLGAARTLLGLPVIITEQYPKGLGPTVADVRSAYGDVPAHEKVCFEAVADHPIAAALWDTGRRTVLLTGMETHICVFQTARALCAEGFRVHVLEDAVASRTRDNWEVGLSLCAKAGAVRTSTEVVLFDMIGKAGSDDFRAISKIVK
ncbi:MAG: isochorismatase family protein [Deltaproteobacteria bacterium]|nr:isochorismatase family protein [Deltaproteobacteria bacterium]